MIYSSLLFFCCRVVFDKMNLLPHLLLASLAILPVVLSLKAGDCEVCISVLDRLVKAAKTFRTLPHCCFEMLLLANSTQPTFHICQEMAIGRPPYLQLFYFPYRFRATLPKEDEANQAKIEAAFKKFCKPLKLKENRCFQKATYTNITLLKFTDSATTSGELQTLPQEIWGLWASLCPGGCPGSFETH